MGYLKKVISLVVLFVMALCLTACSAPQQTPADKVASYVKNSGDALSDSFEQLFAASSDMTCVSSVKAEGTGIVIDVKINELDNMTQEQKDLMQKTYDDMGDRFDGSLVSIQRQLPEMTYMTVHVCEKDGDVIATIQMGEK